MSRPRKSFFKTCLAVVLDRWDALQARLARAWWEPTTSPKLAFRLNVEGMEERVVPANSSSIHETVWFDANSNGVRDGGEPGLGGVMVSLWADGSRLGSHLTNPQGDFEFDNLLPDAYQLQVVTPRGFALTNPNVGADDAVDSDAVQPSGFTGTYSLAANQSISNVGVGLAAVGSGSGSGSGTAAVGDFVWVDGNNNGIQDVGEPGLAGVVVHLWSNNQEVASPQLTDSSGHFHFSNLLAASYQVSFDTPSGYKLALANQGSDPALDSNALPPAGLTATFSLINGQTDNTIDAGFVPLQADLQITKDDGTSTYTPGSSTTYTIVVANAGPDGVTGATVSDLFGTKFSSANWMATATGGVTGFTPSGSGNINDLVNMPALSTITYTVTANISPFASGNLVNTATVGAPSGVTDPNTSNNTAIDSDTQSPPPSADLSINKDDGSSTYTAGNNVSYTITVASIGPDAAQNASFSDALPAGTTFRSVILPAGWTRTDSTLVGGSGTIAATRNAAMPSGAFEAITLVVNVGAGFTGNLNNTATVSSTTSDPNILNNSSTDTDTPTSPPPPASADLTIHKDDGATQYTPGSNVSYSITVNNAGPDAAQNVSLSDALPVGTTFQSLTLPAGWTRTEGTLVGNNGTITATRNTAMPSGTTEFITLVLNVGAGFTGNLNNFASVSSTTSDPSLANNTSGDTDTQAPIHADLSITKTDGVTTYTQGGSTTYTITARNLGPDAVTGAAISDLFSLMFTSVNWTAVGTGGASGFSLGGINDINDTVDMPAGSSITYTAIGMLSESASGNLVNTATIVAPSGVIDPTGNNSATDLDTPPPPPEADLQVTKTDGTATYTPGTSITYTIVVTNAGSIFVSGANVLDTIPANITGATWTASYAGSGSAGPTGGAGNINALVNLAAGGTATFTVRGTVIASATGYLINTANVLAPAGITDPTLSNNTAIDIDTPAGGIAGTVWQDWKGNLNAQSNTPTDGDGIRESGEKGYAGDTATLLDEAGNVVAQTITNASGAYQFVNLPLGQYSVRFALPVGTSFTFQNVGDNPSKNSAPHPLTGTTDLIVLDARNRRLTSSSMLGW